jgi:hypothetical protein
LTTLWEFCQQQGYLAKQRLQEDYLFKIYLDVVMFLKIK